MVCSYLINLIGSLPAKSHFYQVRTHRSPLLPGAHSRSSAFQIAQSVIELGSRRHLSPSPFLLGTSILFPTFNLAAENKNKEKGNNRIEREAKKKERKKEIPVSLVSVLPLVPVSTLKELRVHSFASSIYVFINATSLCALKVDAGEPHTQCNDYGGKKRTARKIQSCDGLASPDVGYPVYY